MIGKLVLFRNKFENLIEQQVVNLIALRQPLAIDLRETVTALKISSDLERIGDLSKNIAKRSLLLSSNLSKNLIDILNTLSDNKGARKTSKRLGRGIGSGKGKTGMVLVPLAD